MKRALGYVALVFVALLAWPIALSNLVLGPVAMPLALAFGVREYGARTYAARSSSMEPTLHCARPDPGCEADTADRVLVNQLSYTVGSPKRGQIVVFETPPAAVERCGSGGTFIKRVVGLSGETVQTRLIGGLSHVFVDGYQLDEPYIDDERRDTGPEETFRVPDGHLFVMGDNRAQSCDSRIFGSVPEGNVSGRVVFVYWPPARMTDR